MSSKVCLVEEMQKFIIFFSREEKNCSLNIIPLVVRKFCSWTNTHTHTHTRITCRTEHSTTCTLFYKPGKVLSLSVFIKTIIVKSAYFKVIRIKIGLRIIRNSIIRIHRAREFKKMWMTDRNVIQV